MNNILYFLISIASYCGVSFFLNQKFKINLSFSLVFAMAIIILVLFFSGILNLLSEGVILINILGFFFFFYFIVKNQKWLNFKNVKLNFLPVFLLLSWFIISNFLFIKEWDEFYWGQFVKSIYYEKKLWDVDSPVINIRWLPGASLFQVYFIYYNNTYNENTVIFASGLIFFISIFCLFNSKNNHFNILIFFLILITVFFFDRMPGTLYLEIYLALLFFILFHYIVFYLKKKNQYYLFPILIFSLALLKIHGLILSVIILIIFYFKMINYRKFFFSKFPEFFSILILIGIFLLNKMWSYHLEKNYFNDLTEFHSFSSIYKLIYKDIFENNFFVFKYLVDGLTSLDLLNNKGRQLFSGINNFIPSPLIYFFLIFLFNLYLYLRNYSYENFLKILFYFGFFLFLFFPYIFMLYMSSTGPDIGLSGAYRYVQIYLMSLTFLIILEFTSFIENKNFLKKFTFFLSLFLIFFIFFYFKKINYFFEVVSERIIKQKEFNIWHINLTKNLKKVLKHSDRVFYVNYGTDGYEAMSFRYHLSPINSNNFDWSIGQKLTKEDIWTRPYNLEDFKSTLNNDNIYLEKLKYIKSTKKLYLSDINLTKNYYTHVYIENTHNNFYEQYIDIFKNKNYPEKNLLFKIKRDHNNEIILLENLNFKLELIK